VWAIEASAIRGGRLDGAALKVMSADEVCDECGPGPVEGSRSAWVSISTRRSISCLHAAFDLRQSVHARVERDVVDAVEVRKERVAPKHHRGTPSRRRQIRHARAADGDVARSWNFVPAIMRNLVVLPLPDGPRRQQ
jgi:hypothetical protein